MTAAGSTQEDVTNIGTACQSVASSQGIDPRVILALIVQESTGYVGVTTTTNVDGQGTGGLMQTSGCQGYPGQSGLSAVCSLTLNLTIVFFHILWEWSKELTTVEPQDEIETMISCGTTHFAGNYKSQGGQNTTDTIYPALREYNSGSVDTSDLSTAPNGAGVSSYVSDIAQRLQGTVF